MKKSIVSLSLLLMFVLSSMLFSGFTFAPSQGKGDEFVVGSSIETSFREEKIFSTAKLEDDFADDSVLVIMNKQETMQFKDKSSKDFNVAGVREVRNLTESSNIALIEQSERSGANSVNTKETSEQKSMQIDDSNFRTILSLQLQEPSKQSVLDTIKLLEKRDDILYAGPNFIHEQASTPTDPRYTSGQQWGLNGTNGIKAPDAWALMSNSATTVRVGVIDTGIDGAHQDLAGMMNNGLHMDFSGTGTPVPLTVPVDSDTHGTHVAGIIAAQGNNGLGVAGVAWNNAWNIRLVSLRINEGGSWFVDNVIEAVNHATANNIQVLNYSGRVRNRANVVNVNDPALEQAIRNYPGVFVTAAGNDNRSNDATPQFPANYALNLPNVISVGSIDSNGARSSFSNWGVNSVSIFAPGGSIMSTLPGNQYGNMSGSSMSAPMVIGA